jgi:hypothetical protein
MPLSIKASVGKYGGGKLCYNRMEDKLIVRDLLDRILEQDGGAEGFLGAGSGHFREELFATPKISDQLHEAIHHFQEANHARFHLIVDGHVDPHEHTIAAMNKLADAVTPRRSGLGLPYSRLFQFHVLSRNLDVNVSGPEDRFFVVRDLQNPGLGPTRAIYWFGDGPPPPFDDIDLVFQGELPIIMGTFRYCYPLDRLEGPATWDESPPKVKEKVQAGSDLKFNLLLPDGLKQSEGVVFIGLKTPEETKDNPDRVGPLSGHFQFVRLTRADFLRE